jgi:hypothetical protein
MHMTGLHTATGHPEGEGAMLMPGLILVLAPGVRPGRPNSPPQTTSVSSSRPRSSRSSSKRGDGRVGGGAVRREIAPMIGVLIPTAVRDLDEAHARLAEAPRQQALAAKVAALQVPAAKFLPTRSAPASPSIPG